MKRFTVVQRHRSRGIKTWYGRIYDADTGKVKYVSLGVEKKKDAMEWRNRMIAEQLSGKSSRGASVSVESAVSAYIGSLNGSSLTASNYGCALNQLVSFMSKNDVWTLTQVTPMVVNDFFNSVPGWSASTRKKRLTIYMTWAKWADEMYEPGWKKNPFVSVRINGARPNPKDFWDVGQCEAIISAALAESRAKPSHYRPETALMYAFMAFAGLRFSEFKKLTFADILDDDCNVKDSLRIDGKGGKVAFVPICTRLREQIISTYKTLLNNPHFFANFGTAKAKKLYPQISTNGYQNRLLQALFSEKSNYHKLREFGGKVHLHRFRHSFISNLVRANRCSIRCIADLARHENPMVTLNTYSHLMPSDKREALEIFSTNNNQGGPK